LSSEPGEGPALLLAIAKMGVQGIPARRVKKIVEELCVLDVSSSRHHGERLELAYLWEAFSGVRRETRNRKSFEITEEVLLNFSRRGYLDVDDSRVCTAN